MLAAEGVEGIAFSHPPERARQSCYALCTILCFCRRGGYQLPANYGVAFRRAADSRPYIRKVWAVYGRPPPADAAVLTVRQGARALMPVFALL